MQRPSPAADSAGVPRKPQNTDEKALARSSAKARGRCRDVALLAAAAALLQTTLFQVRCHDLLGDARIYNTPP